MFNIHWIQTKYAFNGVHNTLMYVEYINTP
jgi:hypothetical protein